MTGSSMADRTPINVELAYAEHGRVVLAILYARCSDRELAHEALQESFLRLQESRFDPIQNVPAWLVRVGQNWLVDVARKKRPMQAAGNDFLMQTLAHEPSRQFDQHETIQLVNQMLNRLSDEDREVLILRYGFDWDSARMGEVLGTNSAAIDMRLSRARKRLREKLDSIGVTQHESLV